MNINGILSLIVALAMMFSGAYGADSPEALSAHTLSLSDISIGYGGRIFELDPSISISAMTENNSALLDVHMIQGDNLLFPIQLAINGEKATLSIVNSGKSFSISNETLTKLLADEGLDLSFLESGNLTDLLYQNFTESLTEEDEEIFNQLFTKLLPSTRELYAYSNDSAYQKEYKAELEKLNEEMRKLDDAPDADTLLYNGKEYSVNIYNYSLDHDQLMAFTDKVYTSNDSMRTFYQNYFDFMNLIIDQQNKAIEETNALRTSENNTVIASKSFNYGLSSLNPVSPSSETETDESSNSTPIPTIAPINSFADIYSLANLETSMDCRETVSDDGEYAAADIVMNISAPYLETPMKQVISTQQIDGKVDMTLSSSFNYAGLYIAMDMEATQIENDFEINCRMDLGFDTEENDEVISESIMTLSVFMTSEDDAEKDVRRYANTFSLEAYGSEAYFSNTGFSDDAGNSSTAVLAGYTDGDDPSGDYFISFNLYVSSAPIESAAPAMEDIEITSELIDIISSGDYNNAASIGIIGGADGPTAIFTTKPDSVDETEPQINDEAAISSQLKLDLKNAVQAAASACVDDYSTLMSDESVAKFISAVIYGIDTDEAIEAVDESIIDSNYYAPPELSPEFAYLPDGYSLDSSDTDVEYGSYSYSFYNPTNEGYISVTIFSYVYEGESVSYSISADGTLTPVERTVRIDQSDDDYFALIEDNGVSVSISYTGENLSMDEIGRFIAGITY